MMLEEIWQELESSLGRLEALTLDRGFFRKILAIKLACIREMEVQMAKPQQLPRLKKGRWVRYDLAHGDVFDEGEVGKSRPALVVRHRWDAETQTNLCDLTIFLAADEGPAMLRKLNVRYDEHKTPGTWHWPKGLLRLAERQEPAERLAVDSKWVYDTLPPVDAFGDPITLTPPEEFPQEPVLKTISGWARVGSRIQAVWTPEGQLQMARLEGVIESIHGAEDPEWSCTIIDDHGNYWKLPHRAQLEILELRAPQPQRLLVGQQVQVSWIAGDQEHVISGTIHDPGPNGLTIKQDDGTLRYCPRGSVVQRLDWLPRPREAEREELRS